VARNAVQYRMFDYAINVFSILMVAIVAQLIQNVEEQKQAARNAEN
jgi:hypothetical protein